MAVNNKRWWTFVGSCVTGCAVIAGLVHFGRAQQNNMSVNPPSPLPVQDGNQPHKPTKTDAETAEEANRAAREKEAAAQANIERYRADLRSFQSRIDGDRDTINNSLPMANKYAADIANQQLTPSEQGNARIGFNACKHRVLDALSDLVDAQKQVRYFRSNHPEIPEELFTSMLATPPAVPFAEASPEGDNPLEAGQLTH